jgi:predicted nucleic-acid-binding protein
VLACVVAVFSSLLQTAELAFEDEPSVEHALYSWKNSLAEFSDCLIDARNRRLGCRATATFDRKALKLVGFIEA